MKRTKKDALQTKQLIAQTAYETFKAVGYDKASLVDIAKNANLSRGAVYWHFNGRQELYEYVIRWKLSQISEEKENLFADENITLKELIKNLLKLHIKDNDKYFFVNQTVYLKLSHNEFSEIALEVEEVKKVYFEKLYSFIIKKMNADNKITDELCREATGCIYTLFEGIHLYNLPKITLQGTL